MMQVQAGRERGRHLACGDNRREVPRRKGRHRPDGLHQGRIADVGLAGWDDAAIGAASFLGEPVDDIGRGGEFDARLHQHLALFERHDAGEVVEA